MRGTLSLVHHYFTQTVVFRAVDEGMLAFQGIDISSMSNWEIAVCGIAPFLFLF